MTVTEILPVENETRYAVPSQVDWQHRYLTPMYRKRYSKGGMRTVRDKGAVEKQITIKKCPKYTNPTKLYLSNGQKRRKPTSLKCCKNRISLEELCRASKLHTTQYMEGRRSKCNNQSRASERKT
jgi:hypothetical protein